MMNMNDNTGSNHYGSYNYTMEDYKNSAVDRERDKNKRLRLEETWMALLDPKNSIPGSKCNRKHNNILDKPAKNLSEDLNWNEIKVELHATSNALLVMHICEENHTVSWTNTQHIWKICKQITNYRKNK